MRIVDRMGLKPNKCAICRHGSSAVDTTKNYPPTAGMLRNGRIYICDNCVDVLARTKGYLAPAAVADLEAHIADLKERCVDVEATNALAERIKELRESLEARDAKLKPKAKRAVAKE